MSAHTPTPLTVLFGGNSCVLHAATVETAGAKNRMLRLPRNGALGDSDPNVKFLRALAAAPQLVEAAQRAVKWMDARVVSAGQAMPGTGAGTRCNGIRSWSAELRHGQHRGQAPEWLYAPTMTAAQARRELARERLNAQVMLSAALAKAGQ